LAFWYKLYNDGIGNAYFQHAAIPLTGAFIPEEKYQEYMQKSARSPQSEKGGKK
jgi:hypothetical protein